MIVEPRKPLTMDDLEYLPAGVQTPEDVAQEIANLEQCIRTGVDWDGDTIPSDELQECREMMQLLKQQLKMMVN